MASTESPSFVSSHKAVQSPEPATTDSEEKLTYIRFLVSNAAAGSIIGKGGSTIADYQSKSGTCIQLSRYHEVFPGTTDRIILISGLIDEIIHAVELILVKLQSEYNVKDANDIEPRIKVRLIVPNGSCGCIIGKGGSIIKSFIEDSGADIKISPPDNSYYGLSDRLVTLTGTLEEQMQAIDLILTKLTNDNHYSRSFRTPYSYPGVFFSGFGGVQHGYVLSPATATCHENYSPNVAGGEVQNSEEDRSNSLTIGVADEYIGMVVGRGGRNIMEIIQMTGASVKISDRGDFMSGTTDRKVTISGSQRAIDQAESMIMQKVAYASSRAAA